MVYVFNNMEDILHALRVPVLAAATMSDVSERSLRSWLRGEGYPNPIKIGNVINTLVTLGYALPDVPGHSVQFVIDKATGRLPWGEDEDRLQEMGVLRRNSVHYRKRHNSVPTLETLVSIENALAKFGAAT